MPMMHRNDDYTYALWRFNEPTGSIAYDEAGKHDLHLTQGPSTVTITSGKYKQYARYFSADANEYFYRSSSLNDVLTGSWTLEFVASPGVLDASMYVPFFNVTTSAWATSADNCNIQVTIYRPQTNLLHMSVHWESGTAGTNVTTGYQGSSAARGHQNSYSHFAITKNMNADNLTCNVRFYIDGFLVSTPLTINNTNFGTSVNNVLMVGQEKRNAAHALTSKGYLSGTTVEEIRFSNIARNELEIRDSAVRCFFNSIHSDNPIAMSITRPGISASNDSQRNETRVRLNFSKHMSMTTLATASNYTINPNTCTISAITASFDQKYTDLLLTNVDANTIYYVTASTDLIDIDGNNIQSGSNVVPLRFDVVSKSILMNMMTRRKRLLYHMRGKSGSDYVYWSTFDTPDKNGVLAPATGLTDIIIDNVSYDPV